MATFCPSTLKLCAVRLTLLDADGTPNSDPDNIYVTDKIITLGMNPVVSEGADREVRSGCDCIIAEDKADDILKRFSFEIGSGVLEPGMIAMLLGQQPINNEAGDVIGVNWTTQTLVCGGQNRVALEGWTVAQNFDHPDETLPWVHFRWPDTRWQIAANTLSADFTTWAFTGYSRSNPSFGDPYNDLPLDGTYPIDASFFAFWQCSDNEFPTPACGTQTLVIT